MVTAGADLAGGGDGPPVPLLARFFRRVADVACARPRGRGGAGKHWALPLDADFVEWREARHGAAGDDISVRWQFPGTRRLVAVGDLHGDEAQARAALVSAGVLDPVSDRWCGGGTVLVQVGDVLDRGGNEVELYYLLERLKREAKDAGGAVHILMGNHESLNVGGRLRYASKEGAAEFKRYVALQEWAARMRALSRPGMERFVREMNAFTVPGVDSAEDTMAWRRHALRPGSPFVRRFLADNPVVLKVGPTLFVHGGLLPNHMVGDGPEVYGGGEGAHLAQLGRLNEATRRWARGEGGEAPAFTGAWFKGGVKEKDGGVPPWLRGGSAPVWARHYSAPAERDCACDALGHALRLAGAARQVVGHTIQAHGITEACEGRVFRVDVGMSKGCIGGAPQALEILGEGDPSAAAAATPTISVIGKGGTRSRPIRAAEERPAAVTA